jgi:hypothetical protein
MHQDRLLARHGRATLGGDGLLILVHHVEGAFGKRILFVKSVLLTPGKSRAG